MTGIVLGQGLKQDEDISKMTRKRFIKLLMSSGISRNNAVRWSAFASGNRSYEELYADLDMVPCTFNKQMQQLKDAFGGMATVISRVCSAIAAGFAAFNAAYNERIKEFIEEEMKK